jgi:hypothetical protein
VVIQSLKHSTWPNKQRTNSEQTLCEVQHWTHTEQTVNECWMQCEQKMICLFRMLKIFLLYSSFHNKVYRIIIFYCKCAFLTWNNQNQLNIYIYNINYPLPFYNIKLILSRTSKIEMAACTSIVTIYIPDRMISRIMNNNCKLKFYSESAVRNHDNCFMF